MPEKRILLVRSDVRLAGPGMLMHGIASALREIGWHVEIASGGGALVERFEADGFVHHHVSGLRRGNRQPLYLLAGSRQLRRILVGSNIDYVHSFNAQAGLLAWTATLGSGRKLINTVLGAGMEWALRFMPFRLIAVSEFVKRELLGHGVAATKIDVVYNGIVAPESLLPDREAFDALWECRDKCQDLRFVSIAMMNGDKGHRASIEALGRLRQRSGLANARLVLIGDGPLRAELERFAIDNGQGRHVDFMGARSCVFDFLDQGHVFLHLSPKETFGMVLVEAQARGLPTIANRIGGIPEVVDEGKTGLLVEKDDIESVVEAMALLGKDLSRAREMGWAGLNRARKLFVRPRLSERLEEVYAKL